MCCKHINKHIRWVCSCVRWGNKCYGWTEELGNSMSSVEPAVTLISNYPSFPFLTMPIRCCKQGYKHSVDFDTQSPSLSDPVYLFLTCYWVLQTVIQTQCWHWHPITSPAWPSLPFLTNPQYSANIDFDTHLLTLPYPRWISYPACPQPRFLP